MDAGRTLTPADQRGDGAPPVMLLRLLTVHVPRLCSARKNLTVAGASPALVSSLLIRSDQLRLSTFGFRSASSTLAAQWSTLRFVVQLSVTVPVSPTLRFACAFTIKSAGRGGYLLLLHCPSPLLATVRVLSTPPLT